jgi:UDP-N-acetylmuramoylalanine--D-glutamate ligase
MDVAGKTAVVVGLGRSGVAAASLLLDRGARVVGTDATPRERASAAALALEARGATLALGGHPDAIFAAADFVVVSPGVPSFPALEAVERSGREVIGELELSSRWFAGPIALVGGTNGKSTTTALVGAMLEASGQRVFVGGNFGTPPAEVVGQPFDVWVLEISSFQAERVPTLHARAHALLNVTDDHLDRYPSFAAYADAKGNPFVTMTPRDTAVIPYGDALCAAQAARGGAGVTTFSATEEAATVRARGGHVVHRDSWWMFPLEALRIPGRHNVANACAALGVAAAVGFGRAPFDDTDDSWLARAVRGFAGLGHRTVLVAEIDGVRYYDDSKGTNVGASVTALRGLGEARAVLIAGGRDKLGDYTPLVDALRERGRALVLLGEAADRIAAAAAGVLPIARAGSMEDAVRISRELALPGDAVLLSPACSSFDMFRSYSHRGDVFARAVKDQEAAS